MSWPGCPVRWLRLRQVGGDVAPLPGVLDWWIERGLHREPLSAGGESLLRAFHRVRELPEVLRMRRDRKKRELEAKARGLLAGRR